MRGFQLVLFNTDNYIQHDSFANSEVVSSISMEYQKINFYTLWDDF